MTPPRAKTSSRLIGPAGVADAPGEAGAADTQVMVRQKPAAVRMRRFMEVGSV